MENDTSKPNVLSKSNAPFKILNALELSDEQIELVNRIFFETSTAAHQLSAKGREKLQFKYLDYYKIYHPTYFLVLCEIDSDKPLGYVCGVPNISKEKKLIKATPYLNSFMDLLKDYPANLHINMAAESRGQGLGSGLIQKFQSLLAADSIHGMHIITAPTARNSSFYQQNGFDREEKRLYLEIEYLFMGKKF